MHGIWGQAYGVRHMGQHMGSDTVIKDYKDSRRY